MLYRRNALATTTCAVALCQFTLWCAHLFVGTVVVTTVTWECFSSFRRLHLSSLIISPVLGTCLSLQTVVHRVLRTVVHR